MKKLLRKPNKGRWGTFVLAIVFLLERKDELQLCWNRASYETASSSNTGNDDEDDAASDGDDDGERTVDLAAITIGIGSQQPWGLALVIVERGRACTNFRGLLESCLCRERALEGLSTGKQATVMTNGRGGVPHHLGKLYSIGSGNLSGRWAPWVIRGYEQVFLRELSISSLAPAWEQFGDVSERVRVVIHFFDSLAQRILPAAPVISLELGFGIYN